MLLVFLALVLLALCLGYFYPNTFTNGILAYVRNGFTTLRLALWNFARNFGPNFHKWLFSQPNWVVRLYARLVDLYVYLLSLFYRILGYLRNFVYFLYNKTCLSYLYVLRFLNWFCYHVSLCLYYFLDLVCWLVSGLFSLVLFTFTFLLSFFLLFLFSYLPAKLFQLRNFLVTSWKRIREWLEGKGK